jgi:glycosyltransferase involved in cell wall biosynthesis
VVATRVGGLVDAIEDGVTGLLVEPDGLRLAIERLLGDRLERERIGAAARASTARPAEAGDALRAAYEEATA